MQEETSGRHPAARVDGHASGPQAEEEGQDSGQGGRRAVSVGTTSQIPYRARNKRRQSTTASTGAASRRTKRDELLRQAMEKLAKRGGKNEEEAEWLAQWEGSDEEGAAGVIKYA